MSEIQELQTQLEELRRANEALSRRVEALASERPAPSGMVATDIVATDPTEHVVETTANRRSMLKLAAGATAGAVVGTVAAGAKPVAADDGNALLAGNVVTSGTAGRNATVVNYVNAQPPRVFNAIFGNFQAANAFLARDNPAGLVLFNPSSSAYPAAVAGYGYSVIPNGVYGFSEVAGGSGVVGFGSTNSVGVLARGGRANARLFPEGTAVPARTDAHEAGELVNDSNGDVWLCTAAGSPGTWRKVSGPSTAGAFHAITPTRVYDSRWSDDKIAPNTNRVVSVANGRDLSGGAITVPNLVPSGATAVVGNLTITGTNAGAGALAVTPGNAGNFSASTINWSGAGVLLANGFTCQLDASRQLKVFCLGSGTNFIIDISGYYR